MKTKKEAATAWMEERAEDRRNGYSQANRWGPDFDCSSFVITAWEQAGVPLKTKGATYTGNMRAVLLELGFKIVTASINMKIGEGLQRGDILLRDKSPGHETDHAAQCVGNGRVVHARSSEGNYQTGDQSGNEIRVQNYWDYPWDDVFRYQETVDDEPGEIIDADFEPVSDGLEADGICGPRTWETIADMIAGMPQLECVVDEKGKITQMPSGWNVTMLQSFLNYIDPEANLDADGDYGPLTAVAVREFQRKH